MITKTWGESGTYATLALAVASISWPLTDNVTLQQVGNSSETASGMDFYNYYDRSGSGFNLIIRGDRRYTVDYTGAATDACILRQESATFGPVNFSNLIVENLNVIFKNQGASSGKYPIQFDGTLGTLGVSWPTIVNFIVRNNRIIYSGTTSATIYGVIGSNPSNSSRITSSNFYCYNNIIENLYSTTCTGIKYASNDQSGAFHNIYIENNTVNTLGIYSLNVNSNNGAATSKAFITIKNNALATSAITVYTPAPYYTSGINVSVTNIGGWSSQFDNYTTSATSATFMLPKFGSQVSSGGDAPSPQSSAIGRTRYLNDITFTDATTVWQIGAMGSPLDLSPPTALTSKPGSSPTSITLTWTPSTSTDGYLVYRTSAGSDISFFEGLSPISTITTSATSAYTDSDPTLSATTDYYYRVRSYRN